MKRTLRRLFIGLFSIVLFAGCVKEDNGDSNSETEELQTISCNGTINMEGLNTNGFEVQSILERTTLSNNGFNVDVFDGDIPQYLMVTNQNGDPVMLYRDIVSGNESIVINAQTTAIAALTFHPALGTAVGNDYQQLVNIITSTQHFAEYLAAVESSIAANKNIYDTTNLQLVNAAKAVFTELMGDTTRLYGGFENVATKGTSPLTELYYCWPIDVRADQNKLKFRLPGCSPSYWCKVYDSEFQPTGEEFVLPTRSNYGVLNVVECLMGKSDWLYGDEVTYTFPSSDLNRIFHFDRSEGLGQVDKYGQIANCILQMLGVYVDHNIVTGLSAALSASLSGLEGGNFGDVMYSLVPTAIDVTLNYLGDNYSSNIVGDYSKAITKGLKWVNLVEGGGNLLLRTIWNILSIDEYTFCSKYNSNGTFGRCSDYLEIVSGNEQTGQASSQLDEPLEVRVVLNQNDHSERGNFEVKFEVYGGGHVSKIAVDVDSTYKASVEWTLGDDEDEEQYVYAILLEYGLIEIDTVIFTATATIAECDCRFVDLGLPSGVKWYTCNVGANAPHEYGNYYAWGETTTKSEYTEENSVTMGQRMSDFSGNPTYDAARANIGGSARMPTKAEMEELDNNCTWTRTTQNGSRGMIVTGPNGNSIFLPAAGYCYGSSRYFVGEYAEYWSSTPYESDTYKAYLLFFSEVRWYNRYYGRTVRPVSD